MDIENSRLKSLKWSTDEIEEQLELCADVFKLKPGFDSGFDTIVRFQRDSTWYYPSVLKQLHEQAVVLERLENILRESLYPPHSDTYVDHKGALLAILDEVLSLKGDTDESC